MSARLALGCIVIGVVDIAYAIALALMVERGFVHAWLVWAVPLLIAGGLFMWVLAARYRRQERA